MSRWKDEAIRQYKKECFKQTNPYKYEMAYYDEEGGVPSGKPPISASGTIVYFPDDESNILNFLGINTEYLVFVNKAGRASEDLVNRLLSEGGGADIIYCDEDFTIDINADLENLTTRVKNCRTVWRKPEYSHDTLLSFPYIETCFAIRTAFARSVPAIKQSFELADNVRLWDFLLRATEMTNRIVRVPKVLYHRDLGELIGRRDDYNDVRDEEIYAALVKRYEGVGYQLCREAASKRRGLSEPIVLENNSKDKKEKEDQENEYLVSIIIPSKDNPDMLKDCIRNIRINAGDIPYEIIVVDNGSSEENKKRNAQIIANIPRDIGKYIYEEFDFNFSLMCNMGAAVATGEYLLFLNDDVDAITDKFLEKLLMYAKLPHVGAVGAKLLYPDGKTIQHVGITNINRGPTHKLMSMSDEDIHYFGRNLYAWNVLAVTGACLLLDREKYFQVGGFSDTMKVGYNDVDLCVKLYENGFLNVVNNECVLLHKESASRGQDLSYEKNLRLSNERKLFYEAHRWLQEKSDPFYSPYLDEDTIEYKSLVVPDYQITDFRNNVKPYKRIPAKISKHVFCNIDRCYLEWGINEEVAPAYVFDGWGLINKADNEFVKKYMIFIPLDEEGEMQKNCIIAQVSAKYRTDIEEVFPDALNVRLAGFECRVPVDTFTEGLQYRMGVVVKKGNLGTYKMTLGDIYEPGRGIITDK